MKETFKVVSTAICVTVAGCGSAERSPIEQHRSALEAAPNEAGIAESLHLSGSIDRSNPFFQRLGSNPRTCETCHSAAQAWTMNAVTADQLFKDSDGLDPLFNLVDQGTRPDADVSTYDARVAAFKELTVKRGLTRFTRAAPGATAEFSLIAVADPAGWSDTTRFSGFRRPTPTANESKASTTNWTAAADPLTQVRTTTIGAARLHEQRDPTNLVPTEMAIASGDFMFGVIFAQAEDNVAGRLDEDGARGGPAHLMAQPFFLGITAPKVFDIFDAWAVYDGQTDARGAARAAIWRGQEVFNTVGNCSGCHNTPNVGGHNVVRFFNIGTAEPPKCDPLLPLLTVQHKVTGETRTVCDLGRAQATGLWSDIGRFRAPPLRGLAPRAPYFHDGQAGSLADVIRHYEERFTLNLTGQQKHDLEAFLRAL